jgi:hypothetical protein
LHHAVSAAYTGSTAFPERAGYATVTNAVLGAMYMCIVHSACTKSICSQNALRRPQHMP